jgi:hypothetical protein
MNGCSCFGVLENLPWKVKEVSDRQFLNLQAVRAVLKRDTVHKAQGCTLTLAVIDLRMHASHHGR